jgi:hypothetical protein
MDDRGLTACRTPVIEESSHWLSRPGLWGGKVRSAMAGVEHESCPGEHCSSKLKSQKVTCEED